MVELGDKVRDTVSGFTGIAMSKTTFLHGCRRVGIQPKVDSDGKLPEYQSFDEPQLEVVTAEKVPQGSQASGGPEKYMDKGRRI